LKHNENPEAKVMSYLNRRALFRGFVSLVVASLFVLSLSDYAGTASETRHKFTTSPAAPCITILYDAFGKNVSMKKDWGFSALIEMNGKRILFDAGDNPDIFAQNVKAAGVDLTRLDFVVISHRHSDHTGGLTYLLKVNPNVKIYAPRLLWTGQPRGHIPNHYVTAKNLIIFVVWLSPFTIPPFFKNTSPINR
jgi:glyoxylase-like metal-dependent hydrolase (beta-lactamase superfamily II)